MHKSLNPAIKFREQLNNDLELVLAKSLSYSKAGLTPQQIALLSMELKDVLRKTISGEFEMAISNIEPIDPVTGLSVPPMARDNYQSRGDTRRSTTAPAFLRDTWPDYLNAHLLYSGHLRKIDLSLYNALTYHARTSLTQLGSNSSNKMPCNVSLAKFCFDEYGLLTSWHLRNPTPDIMRQVSLIQEANKLQSKPIGVRARTLLDTLR